MELCVYVMAGLGVGFATFSSGLLDGEVFEWCVLAA
jgi:F0F1-type ATP synthase membrane subunit c/vacuolar-type H+-ATPase subunit K